MANPKQLITEQFAKELNQNYINSRASLISGSIGKDDADSAWFSLEEMENYLAYIKSEAASKEIALNGIRIYLGVYPENATHGDSAGMTTVFLSPTAPNENGTAGPDSADITEIQPLNYGSMGWPPLKKYPSI